MRILFSDAKNVDIAINPANDFNNITSLKHDQAFNQTKANCSFYTFGYYAEGLCTYYGACRVNESDYMYQGVCGELSNWGEKKITGMKVWTIQLHQTLHLQIGYLWTRGILCTTC